MAIDAKYLFVASMDVDPEKEGVFNEVYDTDHVPSLNRVPGVVSVARFRLDQLTVVMGGETRQIVVDNEPRYTALYEIESPEVLTGEAWSGAVDSGRWPGEVRPYTKNRRHLLLKRV